MIKINLIKTGVGSLSSGKLFDRASSKPEESGGLGEESSSKSPLLIKLFIILSGVSGLSLYENYNLPLLREAQVEKINVLNAIKAENEKVPALVEQINRYKIDKARIEEQIKTIEDLSVNRLAVVKALDLIQLNIPTKLWLAQIKLNGNRMVLDGRAFSDAEISAFIDSLSKSIFFSEVNLMGAEDDRQIDKSAGKMKKFSIECILEVS